MKEAVAKFILASLEHQGFFSAELVEAINALDASVVPLDYAGAQTAIRDMMNKIPCWDACPTCRHEYLSFKANLMRYHTAQHPQPISEVSESQE